MGTPGYMAPEQAEGRREAITTAVDIHALGAILYELLAGRPPFRAGTVLETLRLVREEEPARPRPVNPRIDRDLETIVLKCLEKAPSRRYASAEALADDLDRWLGRRADPGPAGERPERLIKWARRRPTAAALLLVGVVAVSASALAIGGLARLEPREQPGADQAEGRLDRDGPRARAGSRRTTISTGSSPPSRPSPSTIPTRPACCWRNARRPAEAGSGGT